MKKNYSKLKATVLLLFAVATQAFAQMGGNYTINSGQSTGGSNFQTFNAFMNALAANGVSAAVTADVIGGPFNEQVTWPQVTGASAANRITINGQNCLLTFNSSNSTAPHVMLFSGADYFTVNNLQMSGTGTYAYVAMFYNNANYNTFNNCTFSVQANSASSNQIPIVFSNSPYYYYYSGPSGNFNKFNSCDIFSGYMGICMYGDYNAPYCRGNEFRSCNIRDWYVYGIYCYYYQDGHVFANNKIWRPTRTSLTTYYGIYAYACQNLLIDGNWFTQPYQQSPTTTNSAYAMYLYYNLDSYYLYLSLPSRYPNIIRNNLISDFTCNGQVLGVYFYYFDGDIYNNTISFDNAGSTYGGTSYGIYGYSYPAQYNMNIKNNIISMAMGGSGSRYAVYNASGSAGTGVTMDRNDIYMPASSGTNYYAYWTGNATTHAQLVAMGANATGFSVNPQYTTLGSDYHPMNTAINNTAIPMGLINDQQLMPRDGVHPDIGALEFLSQPCSGTPSVGTVLTPTYNLCPGEDATAMLSNFTSDYGITYQWNVSYTSNVGPWTAVPNATSVLVSLTNVTTTTWIQAVATCTLSNQSSSPVGTIMVVGTTTSTVPYYESFEGIAKPNKLPNCSWYSPQLGGTAQTYTSANNQNRIARTGSKFASFYYSPAGVNTMYTNGIWMEPGLTYSVSLWYTTEYYGYNNWSDLSILLGPNQSSTGQVTLATTGGPAISNIYKSLSNTFQVSTAGLYYVAIRATSQTGAYAYYLTWDDLRIEIPCSVNSPSLTMTSSSQTLCANTSLNLTASGADTYTWNTGDNGSVVSTTPINPGFNMYTVVGTNSLSNCSSTLSTMVYVNPAPFVNLLAVPAAICDGQSATLNAFGADSYQWSVTGNGSVINVNPTQTTTYQVVGSNSYGCTGNAQAVVTVNPKPNITAQGPTNMCVGEQQQIQASGGVSYQFVSSSSYQTANPALIMPTTSTSYSVYGTDANGCQNMTTVQVTVDECTGLSEGNAIKGLKVFPNPSNGVFAITLGSGTLQNIQITDVTGRVVMNNQANGSRAELNISALANGVYYVKVQTESATETLRIVKN